MNKSTLIDILHTLVNILYMGLIVMAFVIGVKYESAYYTSLAIFFYIVLRDRIKDKEVKK